MKKILFLIIILTLLSNNVFAQQEFPFQNVKLSDDERIENLISLMTLEEKVDNLSSRPAGVPRLGVKGTRIMEGYHGLAYSGPANWRVRGKDSSVTTTFPQAYGLAQMWDPELIQKIASLEADECRYLAQNKNHGRAGLIIMSPNADLGRDIRWGRTEECYGEDAFLASRLTVAFVKGLQGNNPKYWKTAALLKHFLANSNENERFINSSDIDERLYREYYSYTFYKGVVEGGSRAYMAAYNKVNGIPCAVHPMLKDITVDEWGQNGIICTDGGAFKLLVDAHKYYPSYKDAAKGCINAGINMFLDDYKSSLHEALKEGLVNEEEIDDVLKGLLRVMLKVGLLDNSMDNPYISIGIEDTIPPWTKTDAEKLVREATGKSVVLLKNENNILPINKETIKSVAVIGPSADLVVSDWYAGTPPYQISILDGIKNAVGENVKINYAASNKADSAIIVAKNSDVVIVCVGNHPLSYGLKWGDNQVASDGREAIDREAISLEQEDLVKLVRKSNPNTVLVIVSSFPYSINWSKENVPAILHISQSSQELGNGLADIIFGKISPAGRLVQTWSKSIDELLPILEYDITKGRTYMYDKHEPLFPFGHGLSYTEFEYQKMSINKNNISEGDTLNLNIKIKNCGDFDSDEVVQVYVSYPDSKIKRPVKELKGFKRIHIKSGETENVELKLAADDLKYWDKDKHKFNLEKGEIKIAVGASSADLKLFTEIEAD
ncbi:MAG: glycoside hydrolase family 3 C-terminal domain-containing protein [Melioribacteraceae bacterium]|nr:glycoside hydrolase family 3 C-terminal domain-containing protein [Melioribacteraceae bacterium]